MYFEALCSFGENNAGILVRKKSINPPTWHPSNCPREVARSGAREDALSGARSSYRDYCSVIVVVRDGLRLLLNNR